MRGTPRHRPTSQEVQDRSRQDPVVRDSQVLREWVVQGTAELRPQIVIYHLGQLTQPHHYHLRKGNNKFLVHVQSKLVISVCNYYSNYL